MLILITFITHLSYL